MPSADITFMGEDLMTETSKPHWVHVELTADVYRSWKRPTRNDVTVQRTVSRWLERKLARVTRDLPHGIVREPVAFATLQPFDDPTRIQIAAHVRYTEEPLCPPGTQWMKHVDY